MLINAITSACHWTPPWARTNQSTPSDYISLKIHFHLPVRTESVVILSILCALGLSEAVASFWVSRPNFLLSQRNEELTKDKKNIKAQDQNNHKQNHFLKWQGYWRERVWGTSQLNGQETFPFQSTAILIIQSISIATTTTTDCIISQTEPITALCMTGNTSTRHREGCQCYMECTRTQADSWDTLIPWRPPYIPVFQFASSNDCSALVT